MFNPGKTPRLPDASSNRSSPVHREVHNEGPIVTHDEESIGTTRQEILDKYHIPAANASVAENKEMSDRQRKIRAFSIIKSLTDPQKIFYREGHKSHFELFGELCSLYPEIAADNIADLNLENWAVKKGFLDPQHNNFRGFPHSRQALLNTLNQEKVINGQDQDFDDLPNWFLSADSERNEGRLESHF